MKIVVLDGYTLNPGDLSWEGIKKFGELTIHDRTDIVPENIIKTIDDAEIIFTNKTPLPKSVLEKVPLVKYIGVLATGYNVVDTVAANNPLLKAKNCFITPHIAWAPKESRSRLMKTTVENLAAFLNGTPINVVNQ